MPNIRRRRSRKRPSRKMDSSNTGNISQTALRYSGPVVPRSFRNGIDTRTEVVRLDQDLVSSGSGILATVIGSNPQSYSNWSALSVIYDEYRVLSMSTHFEPYQRYHDATLNTSPIYVVIDRADATALTSYQNALEYASVSLFNTADRWSKKVNMIGGEDAAWTPVGTGISALYIKVYASILTNSTAIGRAATTVLVQFRGTK